MKSHAQNKTLYGAVTLISLYVCSAVAGQQPSVECSDPPKSKVTCEANQMPKCVTQKRTYPDKTVIYRIEGSCTSNRKNLTGAELQAWTLSTALNQQISVRDLEKEPYLTLLRSRKFETAEGEVTFAEPLDPMFIPNKERLFYPQSANACVVCVLSSKGLESCKPFIKDDAQSLASATKELCGENELCIRKALSNIKQECFKQ
jgi:hypothetical protein